MCYYPCMKRLRAIFLLALSAVVLGCGNPPAPSSEATGRKQGKVSADAYLFDARLKRQGKPTSFRLELFVTDSVVAFGGRAYLGKGALKGRITSDSLEVYFPRSHEYLYESLEDMFAEVGCLSTPELPPLFSLFLFPPDTLAFGGSARCALVDSRPRRLTYELTFLTCPWRIEITYVQKKGNWLVQGFRFDDGEGLKFKATRRTFKKNARVPLSRFSLRLPEDVIRISP